ncbi:WD repeat-containing protein 6, partial [Coemansia sp. RSA 2607]
MTGSLSLRLSHLPVTAVEFITDTVVLVGSGASLITYDTQTRSKVAEIAALSNARIHGIICLKDKQLLGNGYRVIAFGSKGWSIVRVCIYSDDKLSMELEQQYLTRDWIKAAHWVYDSNVDCWMVALALAHNRVIICDPNSGAVVSCAQCEEHCILYAAAFFGKTLETLVVASGTVFNQVLIWNPNLQAGDIDQCVDSPIASRLCAHDGVVFGVQFSREGDLVASVSDDRTLRVWNIKEAPCDNQPIATLFGHQARVWKCLVLSKYLVSASEDGTCRVWCRNGNAVGEAVDSWKQCRKNVWSLAANASETLVVSGAADGSICVWAVDVVSGKRVSSNEDLIASEIPTQAEYLPEGVAPRAAEHIRSFALGPSSNPDTFAIMDSGCVLRKRGTLLSDSKAWVLMFYMPELAGYSMVCSTLDGSLTAVGLRDGSVLLLAMSPNNDSVIRHIKRIHGTSVSQLAFSAESESAYDLITMGTDRRVIWSRIRVSGQISWDVLAELRLPGRTRMATAAVSSVAGWMAIGSQNGGLYVYDLPLYLRRLASTTHTAAHEELPAEVPVLELSAHWGKIHGECETTSVVFKTWSPSFAACTADLELD